MDWSLNFLSVRVHLKFYALREPRVVPTLNTYGKGPDHAIRFGVDRAEAKIIVVTMSDGSDDLRQIEALVHLVALAW